MCLGRAVCRPIFLGYVPISDRSPPLTVIADTMAFYTMAFNTILCISSLNPAVFEVIDRASGPKLLLTRLIANNVKDRHHKNRDTDCWESCWPEFHDSASLEDVSRLWV